MTGNSLTGCITGDVNRAGLGSPWIIAKPDFYDWSGLCLGVG